MNISDLRAKVLEEIQHVPAERLIELYGLVHSFRLGSTPVSTPPQNIMQFAGCWSYL